MSQPPGDENVSTRAAGQVLLERLVTLAARASEAARTGDIEAVDALLLEREPLFAHLASALGSPDPESPDADTIAELAQRDIEALARLEHDITVAREGMLRQLAEVAATHAAVAAYVDAEAPGPQRVDVRR